MRLGRRMLVTVLLVASLAAATAAAWPAQASKSSYDGKLTGATGKIEFVLKRKDGRLRIQDFHADGLTSHCASGDVKENFGVRGIQVDGKKRFDAKKHPGGIRSIYTAEIQGRLRGGRVTGTLRLYSGFDLTPICDTGTLEWRAND